MWRKNDELIISSIAPTATPLANFDLEMSEDMFAQDDDGEDSFMENQVKTLGTSVINFVN